MSVFTDAGSVKIPGPPAPVTNGTFNEHTFKTSGNDVNYTYNPNVIPPGGSDVSRPALPGGSTSTQKFQFPSQDALIANEAADSLNYSWAGYFGAYRGDSPQEMTDALISTYQNDMGGATTAVRQKFLAGISEFTARLHNNGINVTHPPLGGLIGEGVGQPGVNVMAGIPQTDTSKGPKVFYSPSSGKASGTANEPLITSGEWAGHTETDKANFIKNNGGDVTAPSAPVTHMFTLIKAEGGDGSVYVLNNRGERFHVSETLSHEMQAGGSWYEPEVKAASEVDKMPLRYTVDSVQNLGTINNATVNDLMFVKGDGGPLDNNTLVGNGNAVYAVNVDGQKFHVTEGGYNDIVAQNGGAAPPIATITQAAVDSSPVSGAIADSGGATVTTTDPLMDKALASAAVVLGDTTNNSPLPGAVITATTAPAIPVAAPPPPDPSAVLTEGPFAGYTNSQVKTFTDGVTAASAAAAPAPAPAPAAPAAAIATAPAVRTDEALAVGNSAENTGQFQIIKGDATNYKPDNELVGNGRAIFVVNAAGQKFHVTGDLMNAMIADGTWHDPDVKPQAEVDSKPFGSGVSLTNIDQLRSINIGAGSEFKLVKDADNESVYAINSSGERYHVSAQLAGEMGASFSNIDTLNPGESNKFGAVKGELNSVADLNKATKDQSASAGGFDGDTSAIPGGFPPVQGYTTEHQ